MIQPNISHTACARTDGLLIFLRHFLFCRNMGFCHEVTETVCILYHLPPVFRSLPREEPLPELSPQTPVSGYSWPRRTQVADKAVSPSCFRSSLPSCPFSWCPLCHSFCPSVVFESCNVSRQSLYPLLDNVDDVIYTCLVSDPGMRL